MTIATYQFYDTAYWPGHAISLIVMAYTDNGRRAICRRFNDRLAAPYGATFEISTYDIVIMPPVNQAVACAA